MKCFVGLSEFLEVRSTVCMNSFENVVSVLNNAC